jgi:hypothetical protein
LIDPHTSMRSSSHDKPAPSAARWHVRLLGDTALASPRGATIDRLPSRAALGAGLSCEELRIEVCGSIKGAE